MNPSHPVMQLRLSKRDDVVTVRAAVPVAVDLNGFDFGHAVQAEGQGWFHRPHPSWHPGSQGSPVIMRASDSVSGIVKP